MPRDIWPFFDLRVISPRIEMRYVDDEMACELAALAARGVHDPSWMPFSVPWTDNESPQLERNVLQYHWRRRAELSPTSWAVPFAVIHEGAVVGTTELFARDFLTLGEFETGSWLGQAYQRSGIGSHMRRASLHLGFAGLGAQWATTAAFDDNAGSLGVTRSLGYTQQGVRRALRRSEPGNMVRFEMARAHWEAEVRQDDVDIIGLESCLALMGLGDEP